MKYRLPRLRSNAIAHKFSLNLGGILKFYAPEGRRSKVPMKDSQVLGANVQNSVAMQKWRLGIVRPFISAFLDCRLAL
jgi:hypothetical protein